MTGSRELAAFAISFGDSIEVRLIALGASVGGVFFLGRILLRYEREFISDQAALIDDLRKTAKSARDETERCHIERQKDRVRLDLLELEVVRLRREVEQ